MARNHDERDLNRPQGPAAPGGLDRRELLRRGLSGGAGLALLGLAPVLGTGCESTETGAGGPTGLATRASALTETLRPGGYAADPGAEIVIRPYKPGDLLEERYLFVAVERARDSHLRVRLRDVKYGGELEMELFRRGDDSHRPVAATARWELFLYNSQQGPVETPAHVRDVISQVALSLVEHEESPDLLALRETVCTFADRRKGVWQR